MKKCRLPAIFVALGIVLLSLSSCSVADDIYIQGYTIKELGYRYAPPEPSRVIDPNWDSDGTYITSGNKDSTMYEPVLRIIDEFSYLCITVADASPIEGKPIPIMCIQGFKNGDIKKNSIYKMCRYIGEGSNRQTEYIEFKLSDLEEHIIYKDDEVTFINFMPIMYEQTPQQILEQHLQHIAEVGSAHEDYDFEWAFDVFDYLQENSQRLFTKVEKPKK